MAVSRKAHLFVKEYTIRHEHRARPSMQLEAALRRRRSFSAGSRLLHTPFVGHISILRPVRVSVVPLTRNLRRLCQRKLTEFSVSITPFGPNVAQLRDLSVQKKTTDASFTTRIGRIGSARLVLGRSKPSTKESHRLTPARARMISRATTGCSLESFVLCLMNLPGSSGPGCTFRFPRAACSWAGYR